MDKSNILIHIVVLMFGAGAWIAVNGVWVELPVLVRTLPEGWNLPSYLAVIAQVGNLGPLVVTLMQAFTPHHYHQNGAIYSILLLGCSSCLLLIFFWDTTLKISGYDHSVPFFILWFALASVDCTSSVTFLPFMTTLPNLFLTTYFIGEGLSGFIPSIFALVQGAGSSICSNVSVIDPATNISHYEIKEGYAPLLYSEEVFFGLVTLMMLTCSVSFIFINNAPIAKKYHINYTIARGSTRSKHQEKEDAQLCDDNGTSFSSRSDENFSNTKQMSGSVSGGSTSDESEIDVNFPSKQGLIENISGKLTSSMFVYCLIVIFLVNAISNGVIPSVSTYISLPYGQLPYHLSATLGSMANPVACFIAMFFPTKSLKGVGVLTFIFSGLSVWLMVLATQSPCPFFVGTDIGAALMVTSMVLFVGVGSYIKISIAQIFRLKGMKKSLVWYGAAVQAGSMVGAATIFPLVNVLHLFKQGSSCQNNCS